MSWHHCSVASHCSKRACIRSEISMPSYFWRSNTLACLWLSFFNRTLYCFQAGSLRFPCGFGGFTGSRNPVEGAGASACWCASRRAAIALYFCRSAMRDFLSCGLVSVPATLGAGIMHRGHQHALGRGFIEGHEVRHLGGKYGNVVVPEHRA